MKSFPRKRYLFIRLLEACNVGCFMCKFAMSRDRYRLSLREFENILMKAKLLGFEFVRFTGGEPLLHKHLSQLILAGAAAGMQMSIITNGLLLPKMIYSLSQSGLSQVIVSVDGASATTHDDYRNHPGIFDKCITGLKMSLDCGIMTRVNTVVGPHNYTEIQQLQNILCEIGVQQWELSALKFERKIAYSNPDHVRGVCEAIYNENPETSLIPMGKRFYGDTAEEQRQFFKFGIPPRASRPLCNLVGDVVYIDAKSGQGFGCSMLPHRIAKESGGGVEMRKNGEWELDLPEFYEHVKRFRAIGPLQCRGCSSTAAGYSDDVSQDITIEDWHF